MVGGDYINNNGTGGRSVTGYKFKDENFEYLHTKPYLLSMYTSSPDSNDSIFSINFREIDWMNGKNVVFGRVFKGIEHLNYFNSIDVDDEVPRKTIRIVDCGTIYYDED